MDRERSKIIEDNPIGNRLDTFRTSFNAIHDRTLGLDAIERLREEGNPV